MVGYLSIYVCDCVDFLTISVYCPSIEKKIVYCNCFCAVAPHLCL